MIYIDIPPFQWRRRDVVQVYFSLNIISLQAAPCNPRLFRTAWLGRLFQALSEACGRTKK